MRKILYRIFTALLIFSVNSFSQNVYYISPGGSDSNSGKSTDNAFQTLQHAADIAGQGDSFYIQAGTYTGFDLRESGSPNAPIVFKALGSVTINLRNYKTPDGINIENSGWIVIDGFNVINQPRAGIRAAVSDHVIIKNNICDQNGKWGIFTAFTDDITIENNICTNSIDEHGIYVSNSSDRPIVKNNQCYGNNGCGLHFNGDISMGGDGIISNALIEGNILHDNGLGGGGSAINMDGVQESVIINNLIYGNHATGIAMYMIDAAEGSKNNKVYNNTIINPSDARWGIISVNGSTGNTLYNNIIINHHSFRGSISIDESSAENFTSDYNLIVDRLSNDDGESNMSLEEWQNLGYDLHSNLTSAEEELFTNYLSGDYTLIEGSSAIDKGTYLVSQFVDKDLSNNIRPQGEGFDIGAYEYISPSGIFDLKIPADFLLYQNYPNPFNPNTHIRYEIPIAQFVTLKVFDLLGNESATLVNEEKPAGEYEVEFRAPDLASGVYFYKLQAGSYLSVKKLMLLK